MRIHLINDENLIRLVKSGSYVIPIQDGWKCGDMIIYYQSEPKCKDGVIIRTKERFDSFPIIYKVNYEYSASADRTVFINDVSCGAVSIFEKLFESYNEITDLDDTVSKFDSVTREKLYSNMESIVKRVHMHKAISDKQAQILTYIFQNKKTKKQLAEEGFCTYDEMNDAHRRFMDELEYCYAFKKEWIIDRANGFCGGDLQFKYSLSKFAKTYGIDRSVLEKIAESVICGCGRISEKEREMILSVIEHDNYESDLSEERRKIIDEIAKKIINWFNVCENMLYTAHAEMLKKIGITNTCQIREYCVRNGLIDWKVCSRMKALGVTIDRHHRGGRYISNCWF